MTLTPLDVTSAVLLDAKAHNTAPTLPVTDIEHPELERLLRHQLEHGSIPAREYKQAQQATGWSKRHIQRKLAKLRTAVPDASEPSRQRFELDAHHLQVIMACSGNVSLAYQQLAEAGEDLPSYETFWRRFNEKPTGIQAYMRHGAAGIVEFWLYPPYQAPERNSVWQADHFELPNDVIADGCTTTLVKPWLTVFVDDCTRKVMGWSLIAEPNRRVDADTVRATICAAVRTRLEHEVEVGGVPGIIRWDNDKSFLAGSVTQLGVVLGFECHAVPPYSGHMKGKVERLGRRIQEQFCALQPGYTHGPQTYRGNDLFRDTTPLTAAQLRARLDVWFAEYDTTPHTSLGVSPLEAWQRDGTPLRAASEEQLREHLLVAPRLHTVNRRKGIHFSGQWWQGAGMLDIVGRKVEVRYPIGDLDFIELYYKGHWHCTGWPAATLSDTEKAAIWDARREMYDEARALHTQAQRIRTGADDHARTTSASVSVASMPADDPLGADDDTLYRLLGRLEAAAETTSEEVES